MAELADLDLSNIERLELLLSPQERVGIDLEDPSDACAKLDLLRLAQRLPRLRELRIAGCQTAIHVGLAAFADRLGELELADIALDGVTIGRLSQLSGLHTLRLARVELASDPIAPLRQLSIARLSLRELDVDSPVAELLELWPRSLREATLEGKWAGHKAMISLAKAKSLERLALLDTTIGNYSLNLLKSLSRLADVQLSGATFNDNTPLYLRHLPVTKFECACPNLGDNGLRQLRHAKALTRLSLPESNASSKGVAHLKELARLSSVEIRDRPIDSSALAALAQLPALQRLELGGPRLEDVELEHLEELAKLEVLRLAYPNLDDRITKRVGQLTQLRELDLGGTRISDAGLQPLAKLTQLRVLKLHHTRVTNRGLAHVGELPRLEVLELDHTDVVDDGVRHLQGLQGLRELRLDSTLVTDRSIDVIAGLQGLERINLADTVVSQPAAERLRSLPNLTGLNLQRTRAR